MAPVGQSIPMASPHDAADRAAAWFWNFLKVELAPYPGRAWVVARMTIAATIVMLVVMIFRLPSGALGAIFTFFLSRENPTATMRAGVRTIVSFALAAAYSIVGIMTLGGDPLTHFLWILFTLLLSFYLIRILHDYGTAVAFGFMIAGAIPLWDQTTLNVNARVENTLWLAFSVFLGSTVTIVVEYVFRGVHPVTDLTEGIESRLLAVEGLLRRVAAGVPPGSEEGKEISQYATLGTSRLRRLLLRSGYSPHFIAQMNAGVSLLGRLVDLAASLDLYVRQLQKGKPVEVSADAWQRCLHLADEIVGLRHDLAARRLPRVPDLSLKESPSDLPFLPAMERMTALIPQAFAGSASVEEYAVAPLDQEVRERLLVRDAFSNPDHLRFALRGALAATACYVTYMAIDWKGLSTSIATCIITALTTIGSSRQKELLRLGGAIIGGIVFGMGAQIFILPYMFSIAGFTVLFAVVTAISAWIATASPRLSYLGVQIALAFYLINLQEFTIQTSLAVARDRVFGVLLGLVSMWLIFDRLWVRNALDELQAAFARNLERFAELSKKILDAHESETIEQISQLRDQINAGFQEVAAQYGAILFEFGPSRARKLKIREDVRRWQPALRTFLLVQITASQYRIQRPLTKLPDAIAAAHIAFERDVAQTMRALADDVSGKISAPAPDIEAAAARLEQEIRRFYESQGLPLSVQAADIIKLTQNGANILAPLYEDIHATFLQLQNSSAPGTQPFRPREA